MTRRTTAAMFAVSLVLSAIALDLSGYHAAGMIVMFVAGTWAGRFAATFGERGE